MNGRTEFVLDPNAVIALLQGKQAVNAIVATGRSLSLSVLTAIEFLAWPDLTDDHRAKFDRLLTYARVLGLPNISDPAYTVAIDIRRSKLLKLPDALIAAKTLAMGATLITRDAGFRRIAGLRLVSY